MITNEQQRIEQPHGHRLPNVLKRIGSFIMDGCVKSSVHTVYLHCVLQEDAMRAAAFDRELTDLQVLLTSGDAKQRFVDEAEIIEY